MTKDATFIGSVGDRATDITVKVRGSYTRNQMLASDEQFDISQFWSLNSFAEICES